MRGLNCHGTTWIAQIWPRIFVNSKGIISYLIVFRICQPPHPVHEPFTQTEHDLCYFLHQGTPVTPVIKSTPKHTSQYTSITHVCHANSTTTFPHNMPKPYWPTMRYSWLRNGKNVTNERFQVHGIGDNTLLIQPVVREDAFTNYTCVAHETDSNLSSSKDVDKHLLSK